MAGATQYRPLTPHSRLGTDHHKEGCCFQLSHGGPRPTRAAWQLALYALGLLFASAWVRGRLQRCLPLHVYEQVTSILGMCCGWAAVSAPTAPCLAAL